MFFQAGIELKMNAAHSLLALLASGMRLYEFVSGIETVGPHPFPTRYKAGGGPVGGIVKR